MSKRPSHRYSDVKKNENSPVARPGWSPSIQGM